MHILDKIVSKIAILFLVIVAIIFIFLPFDIIRILSLNNIMNFTKSVKGNYLYSISGVIVLIFSMKSLFSGFISSSKGQNHIVTHMNFGDLKISDEAIEGLAQNVINKIIGIRSSTIKVDFVDGFILLELKGQVAPDVNIPKVTVEIQNQVKDTIEEHTGIPVSQVNVDILSISSPMKSLK